MPNLPLKYQNEHLFLELEDGLWLVDTGAPISFSPSRVLRLAGTRYDVAADYLSFTAEAFSHFIGVPCVGLIGADVLGRYDFLFDVPGGQLALTTGELTHEGVRVPVDDFIMGIPIVTARVGQRPHRMFLDTGAQYSYFQDNSLATFPAAGRVTDFYPGLGQFETDTYQVPMSLGSVSMTLRCGRLPQLLGTALLMANTQGILGTALFVNRRVGYFPRRRLLVI
ncbi:hypothetical protein NXS98_17295 [Fontisphaera persica]|uniref:hypothetical protein n=1 Tax=Fontisphaera persica TaxID=2974023 RepID=UPI0024BF1B08|nr:hypothetical protein [Fontisphaera persica]WCJ59447.1 hypothetical protein NXS98_17295 [Fontisphaera persica]